MEPLLDGVRVLDLTRVLAGPYASMVLADLGAEVIKVELPGTGDEARGFGPFQNGESAYFASVNRGKKSATIDLRQPRGQDLARRLAGECDVLIENFRPGSMERFGLGYADLHALYPRLVYASISGFGQTGPYAERPAYDGAHSGDGGTGQHHRAARWAAGAGRLVDCRLERGSFWGHRHSRGLRAGAAHGRGAASRYFHARLSGSPAGKRPCPLRGLWRSAQAARVAASGYYAFSVFCCQ